MKNAYLILMVSGIMTLAGCSSLLPEQEVSVENEIALKSAKMVMNFTANLDGSQEVPANESMAQGQAVFQLGKDGTELSYKLIVANIENVRMAHIHLAAAGTNGGVVAWLYPSAPPMVPIPGTSNGILMQGVIKASNLMGSLAGKPLSDLIDKMKSGMAYANVHTDQFPGGEIRGQIMYAPQGME